ncbi:MAG: hypothetical protein WDA60_03010 [Acidimicrobiia bacterium]|jgi:hypothetical protein
MAWDPIGVADALEAQDEYDCLIGPLMRQLSADVSDTEIGDWLLTEMRERFGMTPNGDGRGLAAELERWWANATRSPCPPTGIVVGGHLDTLGCARQMSPDFFGEDRISVIPLVDDGGMGEHRFDFSGLLVELRCHTTGWLEARREWLVREQRRLHVEELAVLRVLDERGRVDDSFAQADGVSVRDVRRKRATARNLERQPNVANAAAKGDLSEEQLDQVTRLVDPDDPASDERWAEEGSSWSPQDLATRVRAQRKPTMEDAAARRAARELRYWRNQDSGMLDGRFSLADVDGALFESVFDEMIEKLRPAKGQAWETRENRGADALVDLCRNYAHVQAQSGPAPHFTVLVPPEGPATVAGIPLPDAMVEALRAEAKIEPVLVDHTGAPVVVGRVESVLSEKTKRVVKQRDGKCRWPGCDRRVGLEVHHCWPSSWGGTDEKWNLATVCTVHHPQLAPQGPLLLLGNPNNPAGLSLIHRDDLPQLADLAATRARAGPEAA